MKHHSGKLVSLLASSILLCVTAMGQNGGLRFSLTDLGTFGGTWSEAWAINDSGTIVGTFGVSGGQRCFSIRNGTLLTFDGGSKPPNCEALALDSKNNIAGAVATAASGSLYRAFRYDNGGKLVVLPVPAGYDYSMGLAIYGATVVGGIGNSTSGWYCSSCPFWFSGLQTAVKWDADGYLTTIVNGRVADFAFGTYARGINSGGEIVGRVYYYPNVSPSAWLWKKGVFTDLPTLPTEAPPVTEANVINDAGYIVGGGRTDGRTINGIPTVYFCAEAWDSHSLTTMILHFCDQSRKLSAVATSSDNWVVGYSDLDIFQAPGPPFVGVPDPRCVLTDLNTLLDASGRGWVVTTANGINRKHQIVGAGVSPLDGQLHAVWLTPNSSPLC
jgi:uncharacterized membrane protein